MRRLVLLTMLASALGLPAAGFAFGGDGGGDDGTLSVRNGAGEVTLRFNGSAIGRVRDGSIRVNDPISSDGLGVRFFGTCDDRRLDPRTGAVTCIGESIRFRVIGGRYTLVMKGTGIFLSAVGRGNVVLDGRGEEPDIIRDGVYSLNDAPYKSLPDSDKSFTLNSPPTGG